MRFEKTHDQYCVQVSSRNMITARRIARGSSVTNDGCKGIFCWYLIDKFLQIIVHRFFSLGNVQEVEEAVNNFR